MSTVADKSVRKVDIYSRFLPELIIEKAISGEGLASKATGEEFYCAVMFADISGFTPLAESFAHEGAVGAEKLTATLNDYFTFLVELVTSHGGDVVKFAGDAVLAIWQDSKGETDLAFASWRAAQCGIAIQNKLRDYEAGGVRLRLRVAISAGPVLIAHVGGVYNRWEFIISGKPLVDVGIVSDHIEPGEVGISESSWKMLEEQTSAAPKGETIAPEILRLDDIEPLEKRRNRPKVALIDSHQVLLRHYLPAAVSHRLEAGLYDFLGELRRLTILFVNLPDIQYSTPVEKAQEVMIALQQSCYRYEGSINKMSVDDKGVSLLAALGLPPLAHEDDPDRGVKAALAISTALEKIGVRSSIGVSTGRVYCGVVGSPMRREYTIMGDNVNLSARLMQNAKGGILVDASSHSRTSADVEFSEANFIKLKGKAELEEVYFALSMGETQRDVSTTPIIGRGEERSLLSEKLDSLLTHGTESIVFIEADQGYGKTRLKDDFLNLIWTKDVTVCSAQADAIDRLTPYYAIRQLLYQCLDANSESKAVDLVEQLNELLNDNEFKQLLPLISSIIPLDLEESEFTAQLEGEVRADQTSRVIIEILKRSSAHEKTVIVIDDVHWLDSASWKIMVSISRALTPMMMVLLTRPVTDPPKEVLYLQARSDAEKLELGAMPANEIVELVCHGLGVESLPDAVASLIQKRAEGHPYYSEEMGYAFRDNGVIEITDGQCVLKASDEEGQIAVPDTIEGIVTSRIDRLSSSQSTTIKIASVIGLRFSLDLLKSILPVNISIDELTAQLKEFEQLNLTAQESAGTQPVYVFKHSITREVAYDTLLNDQRQQLHKQVAEWYEAHPEDPSSRYAVMAFHREYAGQYNKALEFILMAIDEALDEFSNYDAAVLSKSALTLIDEHNVATNDLGYLLSTLGRARRGLGLLAPALEALESSFKAFGYPLPRGKISLLIATIGEAFKQYLFAKGMKKPAAHVDAATQEHLIRATNAHESGMLIYYWTGAKLEMVYTCLKAANLGVQSGTEPRSLIRTYANLGLVTSLFNLARASKYYVDLAIKLGDELDHPPTTAWDMLAIGTVRNATGRWAQSTLDFDTALAITRHIGDERHWATVTSAKTSMLIMHGEFSSAIRAYEKQYHSGLRREDPQSICWGLLGQARSYVRLSEFGRLKALLDEAEPFLPGLPFSQTFDHLSISALMHLKENDFDQARDAIEKGVALLQRPSQVILLCGGCQLVLAILEYKHRKGPKYNDDWWVQTSKFLKTFAGIYPIAGPIHHYSLGVNFIIESNVKKANKALTQALKLSLDIDMPLELVLTLDALSVVNPKQAEVQKTAYDGALASMGTAKIPNPLRAISLAST